MADQVAVMRHGRLAQVAAPIDLYRHPVDVETAVSIGEAVILPAEIRDGVAACVLGRLDIGSDRAPGQTQIMVRPEQISVRAPGFGGGTVARVLDISYFGHDALVRLELSGGVVVTARPAGFAAPSVGQQVSLVVEGPVHAF